MAASDDMPEELLRYEQEISSYCPLESKAEKELGERARDGDTSAREKLVYASLGWILSRALRYNVQQDVMDTVQEGNVELVKAAARYDPDNVKPGSFKTYRANRVIISFRRKQENHAGWIYIPLNLREKMYIFMKRRQEHFSETGEEPSIDTICEQTGWDIETAADIMTTFARYSSDNEHCNPDDMYDTGEKERLGRDEYIERMMEALSMLGTRSKLVVKKYFGIGCGKKTLKQLGKMLNVTKARAGQIKNEALSKIREMFEKGWI